MKIDVLGIEQAYSATRQAQAELRPSVVMGLSALLFGLTRALSARVCGAGIIYSFLAAFLTSLITSGMPLGGSSNVAISYVKPFVVQAEPHHPPAQKIMKAPGRFAWTNSSIFRRFNPTLRWRPAWRKQA